MPTDLAPLFMPRRVALLGVSRNPEKLGHRLLQNLLDWQFPGEVLPVNPSGEPILGVKTVRRARDLPPGIDLALVSLPATAVVPAVRELGERGCRVAVVLASGFGETGEAGRAVEAELAAIAGETGLRIVGPNCMGVVNVPTCLNGSYFWALPRLAGGISFVSQSGAYGGLFFREARSRGFGVAKFVSVGNQADLGVVECLEALGEDPETRVVALFVEGLRDGRAFVETARRVSARKPVVVLKGGRGEAGRRAAGSHTGSLAGTYETYRAAFAAAGLVVAEDTGEFFDAVAVLDAQGGRLPRDARVAVLTVSGGPSVVAADMAEALGLRVPALGEELRRALRRHLPAFGADSNPVDMTPQIEPSGIRPTVATLLSSAEVAGVIAIDIGLDRPEYADAVVAAQAATGKPVVACTADTPEVDARLRAGAVPVFPTPERAVRAYRALVSRAATRHRSPPPPRSARPLPPALDPRRMRVDGALGYEMTRAILTRYGVRFPQEAIAASEAEALAAAHVVGYPVAVKTLAPGVLHKTEAGAVILDVRDPDGLRAAWRTVSERVGSGAVLVQAMVPPGIELLVGCRRDPVFGPVVLVAPGGVLAELMRDVSIRLAPVGTEEARAMLAEGRKGTLLRGFRGRPPCDEAALAAVVTGVGDLLADHPAIAELDLNPVIATGDQVIAVDALVIIRTPAGG
jgi:acetyltransferase